MSLMRSRAGTACLQKCAIYNVVDWNYYAHGIGDEKMEFLLVDFTNVLSQKRAEQDRGTGTEQGATRLRPILMTDFCHDFWHGSVAFAFGEGSEFRSPMGQAVIGGLFTSTLLSCLLCPLSIPSLMTCRSDGY